MYTGIIQGTFEVKQVNRKPDFLSYGVSFKNDLMEGLELGASVNIDGVCQTVSGIQGNLVWFDAISETLEKTTLSELHPDSLVNVERSIKVGQENGGHEISGHVDDKLTVINIEQTETNYILTLEIPQKYVRYIFEKGFLSVHGASLTVANLDKKKRTFQVFLIPETLRLTNIGSRKIGDFINFEIDRRTQVIVDTVNTFLSENKDLG